MSRVTVVYHFRHHERVTADLHEAGMVELKKVEDKRLGSRVAAEEIRELKDIAARLAGLREFLGELPAGKVTVREETATTVKREAGRLLSKLEPTVMEIKRESEKIESRRKEILETIEKLRPLSEIAPDLNLRLLHQITHLKVFFGRIPEEGLEEFRKEVERVLPGRIMLRASTAGKRRAVLLLAPVSDAPKLLPLFYRHSFEVLEIPRLDGRPSELLIDLEKELGELETRERKLENARGKIARRFCRRVCATEEMILNVLERLEAGGLMGSTESTTVMEGWVPERELPRLRRILERSTGGRYVLREEEGGQAPTELENPKVVRDFEFLTEMYGMPAYDEIDPTPFLFLTFPVFFAITLSDAGYGVALAAFLLSGVWIAKIFPASVRRALAVCSIVGIFFGMLIGGWFGFGTGRWMDPISNPIPLLKLVIIIGIVHLLIGVGVAGAIKDAFRGDWASLIFERISKVLIIIGFFGLGFCVIGVSLRDLGLPYSFPKVEMLEAFNLLVAAPGPVGVLRILFYSGIGLGVIGAILRGETVRSKIGGAVNTVYGLTGLMADVASYTRLLALAIASGVIAFSINFIISVFWGWMVEPFTDGFPGLLVAGISACVLAFVFFVAHCFNIFINTLGGVIHTMRLHFAEFFGKFYEGSGKKFSPFTVKRRFTKVVRGRDT
jgi:V/A-type H+-transporting ATPase subunit I